MKISLIWSLAIKHKVQFIYGNGMSCINCFSVNGKYNFFFFLMIRVKFIVSNYQFFNNNFFLSPDIDKNLI